MLDWQQFLQYNPLHQFENATDIALQFQVARDLEHGKPASVTSLWEIPPVLKILKKQQDDGSWKYPKKKEDPREISGFAQLETFRQLGILVEKYLLNKDHPSVQRAAEFLFSCQTDEGDFRGVYLDQYSPNYTAAFLEILIKAGFQDDSHIERGFQWLLSLRQDDGGWVVPLRTEHLRWGEVIALHEPVQPRREKASSHMVTGVVLRAFAAHPNYQRNPDILRAGELLASRIFKADNYTDRKAPDYWTKITFPFWFTDILSTLDSLSRLGFSSDHPNIREGIDWFVKQQKKDGSWPLHMLKGGGDTNYKYWIALVICRMLDRFAKLG
ncbi:MAG: prenyltransferase/squalene oxidase repeat-containing protein [Candidatus Thorarchaeota archaeon]